MSNRYDKQTTTFSQQGRLYQVEYAIEATKASGPALGVYPENSTNIGTKYLSLSLQNVIYFVLKKNQVGQELCASRWREED